MSIITATPNSSQLSVNLTGVTTPTIQNVTLATAGTEYTITLPANTERFKIRVRGSSKLQIAYTSGQTGTNYISIYPGACYEEAALDIASLSIYVQASKSGETLEIVSWV